MASYKTQGISNHGREIYTPTSLLYSICIYIPEFTTTLAMSSSKLVSSLVMKSAFLYLNQWHHLYTGPQMETQPPFTATLPPIPSITMLSIVPALHVLVSPCPFLKLLHDEPCPVSHVF